MLLKDAATKLGLSPNTLRAQVQNGKLRAHKRGRDWHVSPREVERYAKVSKGQAKGRFSE